MNAVINAHWLNFEYYCKQITLEFSTNVWEKNPLKILDDIDRFHVWRSLWKDLISSKEDLRTGCKYVLWWLPTSVDNKHLWAATHVYSLFGLNFHSWQIRTAIFQVRVDNLDHRTTFIFSGKIITFNRELLFVFCLKTFNYEDKIIAQGAYLPPLMSGNQKQAARTYSFIHTKVGNNNNKERKKERTEEKKTLEKCSTFNINQTTFFLSGEWRPSGQCYKNLPDRKGCRGGKVLA